MVGDGVGLMNDLISIQQRALDFRQLDFTSGDGMDRLIQFTKQQHNTVHDVKEALTLEEELMSSARAIHTQAGTAVRFHPVGGSDTVTKRGRIHNINTRHQCITAMQEYESMSLEEIRMQDYLLNRKCSSFSSLADSLRDMELNIVKTPE